MEAMWSWEAKAKQINENSKVGDHVNVGWLSDNSRYNYQEATITWINPCWRYPNGDVSKRERYYQVFVRFDDGNESEW